MAKWSVAWVDGKLNPVPQPLTRKITVFDTTGSLQGLNRFTSCLIMLALVKSAMPALAAINAMISKPCHLYFHRQNAMMAMYKGIHERALRNIGMSQSKNAFPRS